MMLPKTLLFTFILLILNACRTGQNDSNITSMDLGNSIDALIQPYLDSLQIAGVAVGVRQNGETLHQKAYGKADLNWQTPLTIDANFEIGSVTKQFTSVAILQLIAAGKLALEDDFTQYIDYDTKGRTVTIAHLLSHTSGIESYTSIEAFDLLAPYEYPRDTLLRMVEALPFDYEPGEVLIYNNTGYFILGLIIEEITGQTYEEYLEENVFAKAGLSNTYYCDESKITPQKAYGYSMGSDGLKKAGYLDHQWPYAAGSLCSTVEDLLKWNQALHQDKTLLAANEYALIIEPTQLNNGAQARYTKGLMIDDLEGNLRISHGGGIPGFLSANQYFPDADLSIVVLINTAGPVNPGAVAQNIAKMILPLKAPVSQAYSGELNSLVGNYAGVGRGREYTSEISIFENKLLAKPGYGPIDTLSYYGDYWSADNGGLYRFKAGTNGQITSLEYDLKSGYYVLERQE